MLAHKPITRYVCREGDCGDMTSTTYVEYDDYRELERHYRQAHLGAFMADFINGDPDVRKAVNLLIDRVRPQSWRNDVTAIKEFLSQIDEFLTEELDPMDGAED